MGAVSVRDTWVVRLLRRVGAVRDQPTEPVVSVGADFEAASGQTNAYDPERALSAAAAFPAMFAAAQAIGLDLASRPFIAQRGHGRAAEPVDDHPALRLLRGPAARAHARHFHAQVVVDWMFSGDGLVQPIGGPRGPEVLQRWHPQRMLPVPGVDGYPDRYRREDAGLEVPYLWDGRTCMLHFRGLSWQNDPGNIRGIGAVQAVDADLVADKAAREGAAVAAKKGRPDAVVTPPKSSGANVPPASYGKSTIKALGAAIRAFESSTNGGTLMFGEPLEYQPMSWSPREADFPGVRSNAVNAVLMALPIVPLRLGLETANYATAREQLALYWEQLVTISEYLCDEWSRLCGLFGDPDVIIRQDFSTVRALQYARTERLDRVTTHILHGMDAADAYRYEGFADAPELSPVLPPSAPPSSGDGDGEGGGSLEDDPDAADLPDDVTEEDPADTRGWRLARSWSHPGTDEESRAAVWRGFLDEIHTPSEARIALAAHRWLREAASRYAVRVEAVLGRDIAAPVTRALAEADLAAILAPDAEAAKALEALDGPMRSALSAAFKAAAEQIIAGGFVYDPTRTGSDIVAGPVGGMVSVTTEALRTLISDMLDDGSTVAAIQEAIMDAAAFSPARGLRIARTEATRMVNAGADQAFGQAQADHGIVVRKEWLSARDAHVRPEHVALDGDVVGAEGAFTVAGHTAKYPGGFGVAELDINCRCTVIPVVVE